MLLCTLCGADGADDGAHGFMAFCLAGLVEALAGGHFAALGVEGDAEVSRAGGGGVAVGAGAWAVAAGGYGAAQYLLRYLLVGKHAE